MNHHPFAGPGRFYKGNLHTHSTRSDGCWGPAETLERFRQAGYDFVSLTDHSVLNQSDFGMPDDFLVLPGLECHMHWGGDPSLSKTHHFIALAKEGNTLAQDTRIENGTFLTPADTQAYIDAVAGQGFYMILCHPQWSQTTMLDYGGLQNLLGVEVFNTGCHWENDTGYAHGAWSDMLRHGQRLWAFSTDDCHHPSSFFCGWVCVWAPELTRTAILQSLVEGRFYASCGPEIYDFFVEDGEAVLRCSPCDRVFFHHNRIAGTRVADAKGPIIEARFKIPEGVPFIRAQCVAYDYTMAWTQPIYL